MHAICQDFQCDARTSASKTASICKQSSSLSRPATQRSTIFKFFSSLACFLDFRDVFSRLKFLFFEFSLCLSRACLGKKIVFIYKWLTQRSFW